MSHYVIVDGVLQKSSPATERWIKRAAQAVPVDTEEPKDVLGLPKEDHRSDFEIIQSLDEPPEV